MSVKRGGIFRKVLVWPISGSSYRLSVYLSVMRYLNAKGHNKIAALISNRIQRKFGVFISHRAYISHPVRFPHPTGIVIGDGVSIGKFVTIYQNVTLGGARMGDGLRNLYPSIKDGTVIFAGAVVVGHVTVGKDCIIGANSVVLSDIPDNSTAVGAPARVIANSYEDISSYKAIQYEQH